MPRRENLARLNSLHLIDATDEELEWCKNLSDDNLLRASNTAEHFAGAESTRRLRIALQSEEQAIKRLTVGIVALTGVLVVLTLVLVLLASVELLRHAT